jgi:hypothetical protein
LVDFILGSRINIAPVKYNAASRANKNECGHNLATYRPQKKKLQFLVLSFLENTKEKSQNHIGSMSMHTHTVLAVR